MTLAADGTSRPVRAGMGILLSRTGRTLISIAILGLLVGALGAALAMLLDRQLAGLFVKTVVPVSGFVLGVGLAMARIGRDTAGEANLAGKLRLSLDSRGISWQGGTTGSALWDELAHVAITATRPGRRRLRLSTDVVASPRPADPLPVMTMRRLLRLDDYLLDVPVDELSGGAPRLAAEIRRASAGRFPTEPTGT